MRRRRMFKKSLFILLFMVSVSGAFGQSGAKVGDKAPELSIDEWLKGDPISEFEPGKVYLVEFWGTWCGPCIENIPHLSKIQNDYSSVGLTVIGVATHEFDGREKLDKFMEERGTEMEYMVAYDTDLSMEAAWDTGVPNEEMFRLPICFLIDKKGYVIFAGHPSDESLEGKIDNAVNE